MITLHDGSTVPSPSSFVPGDSLLLDEKGKAHHVLPLREAATVLLTGGSHIGSIGTVSSFTVHGHERFVTVLSGNKTITTKKEFAFVVGKDAPSVILA